MTPISTLIPTIIYTAPTSPPDNLTVTSTSPTSISILWGNIPCAERNGDIYYYIVQYNPTSDPSDTRDYAFDFNINSTVSSTVEFTVEGLISRTEYAFVVFPYGDYNQTRILSDTLTVTTGLPQGSVRY